MRPVYLAGRGLASSLGLDLSQTISTIQHGMPQPSRYVLPGELGGSFPYHAMHYEASGWDARSRELVRRVAAEAAAHQSRQGVLFIASSSLDLGAAEQGAAEMDYCRFANKVAGWLDWQGPVYVISTACTSALNAMLSAQALFEAGEAQEALVLGLELVNRITMGGFAALQLLSTTGCKPFGAIRDGLVLGEAVAALRLSTHEKAGWRMLGGANRVDGSQPTGASHDAVVDMYRTALSRCGLDARQIDLIKVQAAGSPGNDTVEAAALREHFSTPPALVSLKAAIGHTMGASGAAEVALLTSCLDAGAWVPQEQMVEPGLGISLAARPPENVQRVMATILGFGGQHASVILERTA